MTACLMITFYHFSKIELGSGVGGGVGRKMTFGLLVSGLQVWMV
jgi:hypothetical protein